MDQMKRYAVYYAPRPGPFADRAAQWLGWDTERCQPVPQPEIAELPAPLAALTADPRRYGFHGTIRAPFRPAKGVGYDQITEAVSALAARCAPVVCEGLRVENLHGFLALIPYGNRLGLIALGAAVVEDTNPLRAPLSEADIARRRPDTLTPRQRDLLHRWGYPFVMEEYRFHLTLTDRLPDDQVAPVAKVAQAQFAPVLPRPFVVEDLCLFAEDAQGRFHLLHRYALTG